MTARELRELREAHGLSQEELAKLLGVSQPTVSRWEEERKGKGQPGHKIHPMAEKLIHMILPSTK